MIRRNVTTENGQAGWLLISQVEHARLSGELAEHWGNRPSDAQSSFLPLIAREELLPAIYHHDDGWQQWEESPEIDPQTGRPLAFTEMPLGVALGIWRTSISRAKEIGPLAGWVVASHFTALLSHSHEAEEPLAKSWLEEFGRHRHRWLQAWESSDPQRNSQQNASTALHQLQLFDLLSLWLCMAERTVPQKFDTPGGTKLKLTPQADRQEIALTPWPLTTSELLLTVAGRLVPVRVYADRAALAGEPNRDQTLSWHLIPGPTVG